MVGSGVVVVDLVVVVCVGVDGVVGFGVVAVDCVAVVGVGVGVDDCVRFWCCCS